MDNGVVPPCSELGQGTPEHLVLAWMSVKIKRPTEYQLLLNKIAEGVFDSRHGQGRADEALRHLFDQDTEFIRKVDFPGGPWGLEVVQKCWCKGSPVDLLPRGSRRLRRVSNMQAAPACWVKHTSVSGVVSLSDVVIRSSDQIEKYTPKSIKLAKDVFAQLVEENPLQRNSAALADNLKRWHRDGMEWTFIEQMMEEFAKHPEWCRRAKTPPWRVFLARKQELVTMVLHEQQRKARMPERPLTPLPGTTLAGTANHMYERPAQPFART
jgi:hypothetical protein